jgi:pseudaminic acid synthase
MKTMNTITIANREIGFGKPCFVVAELSGNHHGNYKEAVELVRAAKEAGADAVKLQTYTPDTITLNSRNKWFVVEGGDRPELWQKKSLYELYETAYTPWDWQPKLKRLADELGIILFSSPFDETAVDFLETEVGVPCYKVASYEAVHIPLLKKIASIGKPVIMSIGFASEKEVELALETLRNNGAKDIAILHCVTSYADKPGARDMNLRTVGDISERFGVVSGFSDNNGGIEIPVAAALLGGASVVEKHFILDRAAGGPDARFSADKVEFKRIVELIRKGEKGAKEDVLQEIGVEHSEDVMGQVHYGSANQQEKDNMQFRPGVWAKKDIKKGEELTFENIRVARPNDKEGFMPKDFDLLLGKKASHDIAFATPITKDVLLWRVREAKQSDALSILEIRNSEETRAQSLKNQEFITKEDHTVWFKAQYGTEGSENKCYVIEDERQVVGYCRFDKREGNVFEVSIAVASGHSGKGLGSFLLAESLEWFCAKVKGEVRATIRKNNTASVRLFEKRGFRFVSEDSVSIIYAYHC